VATLTASHAGSFPVPLSAPSIAPNGDGSYSVVGGGGFFRWTPGEPPTLVIAEGVREFCGLTVEDSTATLWGGRFAETMFGALVDSEARDVASGAVLTIVPPIILPEPIAFPGTVRRGRNVLLVGGLSGGNAALRSIVLVRDGAARKLPLLLPVAGHGQLAADGRRCYLGISTEFGTTFVEKEDGQPLATGLNTIIPGRPLSGLALAQRDPDSFFAVGGVGHGYESPTVYLHDSGVTTIVGDLATPKPDSTDLEPLFLAHAAAVYVSGKLYLLGGTRRRRSGLSFEQWASAGIFEVAV